MDVGKAIAQRRKDLKITQLELAELASIGLSTVKDIERGAGNPSYKTLEKICTVLGLKISLSIKKIEA